MTIHFLSQKQVVALLTSNGSYFRRFCAKDWLARGVRNLSEYISVIHACAGTFTRTQKNKLKRASRLADQQLSTIDFHWFRGQEAARTEWSFACVHGNGYDNGLPHTVDRTIVLTSELVDESSDEELVRLLKHEKTHVLQRLHPAWARNFLKAHNFRRLRTHRKTDGIRANPDTNGVIYERFGEVFEFRYTDRVHSLDSVKPRKHARHEHPYEWMAYMIEKL